MKKKNYLRYIYAKIGKQIYQNWLESPKYLELQSKLLSIKTPKLFEHMAKWHQMNASSQGENVLRMRTPHPDMTKAYDEIRRLKKVLRRKGPEMVKEQHDMVKKQIQDQWDLVENFRGL